MQAFQPEAVSHLALPSSQQMTASNTESLSHMNTSVPPSVLAVSVKIIPEKKVLSSKDTQTLWVAIELEGVLHNERIMPNVGLDIVLVIDNGYYVTSDALDQAIILTKRLLFRLEPNDRIAIYTTHCTHEKVASNTPELWFAFDFVNKHCIEALHKLLEEVNDLGCQTPELRRCNPGLSEVIRSIANSIEGMNPRHGQTHVIFLSPKAVTIHNVSPQQPHLYVHQINVALLPFHGYDEPEKQLLCDDPCCDGVSFDNMVHFQSPTARVAQILRYGRCQKPFNAVHSIHLDLRRQSGCEVTQIRGSTTLPFLHLGQVHTIFAEIKVDRSEVQEARMGGTEGIRKSSLLAHNFSHDMMVAKELDAVKVHLLSVRVEHRDSYRPHHQYTVFETPFFAFKALGRVSEPMDVAHELYMRRFFYELNRLEPAAAKAELARLAGTMKPEVKDWAGPMLDGMAKAIRKYQTLVEHEGSKHQGLPAFVGPVEINRSPHRHLRELVDSVRRGDGNSRVVDV